MLIMLTTGYCNFFWGGFCHAGYQQALQCQGLQSVYIWFTLAEFQGNGICQHGASCYTVTVLACYFSAKCRRLQLF